MLTARVSLAKKCGGVFPEGIAFLYLLDAWSGEMDRRGLAAFTRSAYSRAAREYLLLLEASGIISLEAADRASVFGCLASLRGRWARINGNAYVLSDQGKAGFIRSQPYLLPQTETKLFFRSAALLDVSSSCKSQAVAFFALMHSCGLRTGKVPPSPRPMSASTTASSTCWPPKATATGCCLSPVRSSTSLPTAIHNLAGSSLAIGQRSL